MSRHGRDSEGPDRPVDPWTAVSGRRPRRKRVVLADGRGRNRLPRTIVELEEQTSVGEKLVRDLVRAQLRSAFWLAMLVVALVTTLPAAFYLWPWLSQAEFLGVRLPWLLLGLAPFPLLYGVGYWYRSLAERHERDFVNMVDR
jgi:hypothetical protein